MNLAVNGLMMIGWFVGEFYVLEISMVIPAMVTVTTTLGDFIAMSHLETRPSAS